MEKGDLCDFVYQAYKYHYTFKKCIYTVPIKVAKTLFYDILVGIK